MQVCLVKTVTDHICTDGNCVPDFFLKSKTFVSSMSGAPTSVAQIIIWKWGKKVFLFFLFSKRQLHAGKLQRNKNSYKFVLPFTEKHSGLKQNRRIGRRPWCTAEKKDKVHTEFVTCVFWETHTSQVLNGQPSRQSCNGIKKSHWKEKIEMVKSTQILKDWWV